MKNQKLLTLLFSFFILATYAQEVDYSVAKVGKKIQGIYIFMNAEPIQQYDYIATIEISDFWSKRSPQEAFEKVIKKAKNKYPNFNAIIFHNDDFEKADLIKFKGLELNTGGLRIGDKITYRSVGDKITYGEIIAVNNSKQDATFKYLDEFNAEVNETVKSNKLQLITGEEYEKGVSNSQKNKRTFSVGQKVSWNEMNKPKYGTIQEIKLEDHRVKIKYIQERGEEKIKSKSMEDIFPATDNDYQTFNDKILQEVAKHKYKVGDKVKWMKTSNTTIHATVLSFNESEMNATIKYLDDKNVEKVSTVDSFDLLKEE